MLAPLANMLILEPSTHPIPTPGRIRRLIPFGRTCLEVWTQQPNGGPPDLYVLKLPGAGGRAERATEHPLDYWTDLRAELWAVNPPGYGGSPGRPSVRELAPAALAAHDAMRTVANGRPILVIGNSLGTAAALHVAATREIAGLILRNPPPLREVIVGRHGWWSLYLGAMLIAQQVPDELDSVQNAAHATAPALFVMSQKDRVVPPAYQEKILRAYAGPKHVLPLADADHATPITSDERPEYARSLDWLRSRLEIGPA